MSKEHAEIQQPPAHAQAIEQAPMPPVDAAPKGAPSPPPSDAPKEGAPTVATVGAVLAVDIGSLHTRATLFDVKGDEYRYIERAAAPKTYGARMNYVHEGV